jgi:nucleoside diphosphate kinase
MTSAPGGEGVALTREVGGVSLQTQSTYIIKRNFWSLFERIFRVLTHDGQIIMFVKHPIFRLREEFKVFADEAQSRPLLTIKSKQVIAINFSFDVTDEMSGRVLGTVQKRGFKSIVRDKFLILDPAGVEIGYMEEQGASILRRFIPLLTSKHAIVMNGAQVAFVRQKFRFFTKEFDVEMTAGTIDPRFVLACALLALIAEARRENG